MNQVLKAWGVLLACAILFGGTADAQPNLNFKRITVNWPTIELYFSVGCNGNPVYNMAKQDFKVFENGAEVKDFTLWCPDPTVRCAISVALVFDASGSMMGTGNAGAKAGGREFVDQMDGQIDEAAIIWFNTQVNIQQQMTTLKPLLYSAVDALPASGGTAVWDGTYAGVIELINNGINQCRAVIVVTDGGDNASTRTPAEVISLANRNRIRVFTIGLGTSINATELEMIALLTGGRYYQTPNAGQLAAIYKDISTIIFQGFQECVITYERDCADGGLRTVELQLINFCGGTDVKTKTYRAPQDSTSFSNLHLSLGDVQALGGSEFQLPLDLTASIDPEEMFYPLEFRLYFNSQCMQFKGASAPSGSLLDGVPIQATPVAGGVHIATTDRKLVQGNGLLLQITFEASDPQDSIVCQLNAANARFEQGCHMPVISDGSVTIHARPHVTPDGLQSLCEGDSVILEAPSGYTSYYWSSGEYTRTNTVKRSGDYWVTVTKPGGPQLTSNTVTVVVHPRPLLQLTMQDTVHICEGGTLQLGLKNAAGLTDFNWSNGMSSKTIAVTESGTYYVTAANAHGCYGRSDTVTVIVDKLSVSLSESGTRHLCYGDSLALTAGSGFQSYQWSTGDTTASTVLRSSGLYFVRVTDAAGCYALSDTLELIVHDLPEPQITPGGAVVICPGESVELDAGEGYTSYVWSSGDTTRKITVDEAGEYTVEVTNTQGCSGESYPVQILIPEPPEVTPGDDQTLCFGDSVRLSVVSGYPSYQWSTGASTESIRVGSSGQYFLQVEDINGCLLTSDTLTVTVLPPLQPTITPLGPTEFCEGEDVTLDAGEGYAVYRWSSGENSRSITVDKSGVYAVTVTDQHGCSGISNPVTVSVSQSPDPAIVVLGSTSLCEGDSVVLDAGSGYSAYRWSTAQTTQRITVTTAGSYSVTVWNASGCEGTASPVDIVVAPSPDKPVITQSGDFLTTDKADDYQWFKDGVVLAGETNQFLKISEAGTYQVRVSNEYGCWAMSDPFLVTSTGTVRPAYITAFDVYPDPNDGTVNVSFRSEIPVTWRLTVTNVLGQIVYERVGDRSVTGIQQQIDLQSTPRGIYLIHMQTGNDVWTRRIVRE